MDKTLSLLVKFAALDRLTQPLRAMSNASKKTKLELAAARKEVTQLERATAKVDSFKALQGDLARTHQEMDTARRRARALRAAIEQADGKTGHFERQLGAAERQLGRLDRKSQDQVNRLQRLGTELGDAGVDVRRLATEEDRLGHALGDANRRMDEQREKLERAAAAREKLDRAQTRGANLRAGGFRAAAVGTMIGRPVLEVADEARDFQSSMVDIQQKADLSATATARMAANIRRMAPDIAQMPEALQAGIDQLAGLGMDPRLAQRIIEPIGRTATAYKADVADIANASFSSIDNLKVAATDTAKALDVMAYAGKAGAFEMKDMAQFFPALTASAQALGQRGVPAVADLAAALQITRKGAGDSSTAANNLQNLLNKINTKDTITNFKKFGIDLPNALKKAYAEGKTPIEAIAELVNKATGGDLSKLAFLFGDAQVQAALRPLLQNLDLYRRIRSDALKATGTVEADFATRMAADGAAKQARFNARLAQLKMIVGNALLPTLNQLLDRAVQLGGKVAAWADKHPALARGLALTTAGAAALLVVLGGAAIVIGTILGPFAYLRYMLTGALPVLRLASSGFLMLGKAALRAGVMMLANPMILAITAVVAAIAIAGYLIWKHWDKIKAAFAGALSFLSGIWNAVTARLQPVWTALQGLGASFGRLGSALVGLGSAMLGALGVFVAPWVASFKACASVLGALFGPALRAIGGLLAWAGGLVMKFLGILGGLIGSVAVGAWKLWSKIVTSAITGVIDGIKGVVDWVTSGINLLTRFFSVSGKKPAAMAQHPAAGPALAGKRASGGPVGAGRLYLVGERGPELFMAPGNGRILPNALLGAAAAASFGAPLAAADLARPIAIQHQAAPTTRAASGARPSYGAPAMTIGEVHIHLQQQPGEDAADLAGRIRDELARVGRDAAAARRSSYEDVD